MNTHFQAMIDAVDDIKLINEVGEDADFLADIDPVRLFKLCELVVKACDNIVDQNFDDSEPWLRPGYMLEVFGIQ